MKPDIDEFNEDLFEDYNEGNREVISSCKKKSNQAMLWSSGKDIQEKEENEYEDEAVEDESEPNLSTTLRAKKLMQMKMMKING